MSYNFPKKSAPREVILRMEYFAKLEQKKPVSIICQDPTVLELVDLSLRILLRLTRNLSVFLVYADSR